MGSTGARLTNARTVGNDADSIAAVQSSAQINGSNVDTAGGIQSIAQVDGSNIDRAGGVQSNAQSGCDSREADGAVQSSQNPSGTVHFSHCLHERRHITEATSGFTCFACKQRCKGLLVMPDR